MKPAEQNQVVQVGGTTVGPMLNVVDLDPCSVPTSGELAVSAVTMGYQSSQPAGDGPGVPSDSDHDTAVGDHRFDNTITGQSSGRLVGDECSAAQFGDTGVLCDQCFQIGMNRDLGRRNCGLVSAGGTNLHQPVGHPLSIGVEQTGFGVGTELVGSLGDGGFDDFEFGVG